MPQLKQQKLPPTITFQSTDVFETFPYFILPQHLQIGFSTLSTPEPAFESGSVNFSSFRVTPLAQSVFWLRFALDKISLN